MTERAIDQERAPLGKPTVLYAVNAAWRRKLWSEEDSDRVAALCRVIEAPVPEDADRSFLENHIGDADIVISGWGTAPLGTDVMARAGRLKLLAHAAGSVRPVVSDALWDRGVQVTSAAAAIACGVAEFCLGLILIAPKRAFWAGLSCRQGEWREGLATFGGPQDIYQETIGIIGAGHVGRALCELLRNFTCRVILFDPYCSSEAAAALGAEKVDTLDAVFEQSLVVSLNAPTTEETRKMLRGRHFRLLREGAVFINTARAAIVDQAEMIEELEKGRFVACLDVTDPEPPPPSSRLRSLPNVWLTPHEAGAVAQNLRRIGTSVADEIEALVQGRPFHFEVTREKLANMA